MSLSSASAASVWRQYRPVAPKHTHTLDSYRPCCLNFEFENCATLITRNGHVMQISYYSRAGLKSMNNNE